MELLNARYPVEKVVATDNFISENQSVLREIDVIEAKPADINSLGTLKSNNATLAIAKIVQYKHPDWDDIPYALLLDDINDPGNLGTILRIADWYGIKNIVASENTVELHNPKVISASKGSFLRVKVLYENLESFLSGMDRELLAADMEGISVHKMEWPKKVFILMGNEANGISPSLEKFITKRISIPGSGETESLNVAVATAITLDNWFRSKH